jgi:hypothetical protein
MCGRMNLRLDSAISPERIYKLMDEWGIDLWKYTRCILYVDVFVRIRLGKLCGLESRSIRCEVMPFEFLLAKQRNLVDCLSISEQVSLGSPWTRKSGRSRDCMYCISLKILRIWLCAERAAKFLWHEIKLF